MPTFPTKITPTRARRSVLKTAPLCSGMSIPHAGAVLRGQKRAQKVKGCVSPKGCGTSTVPEIFRNGATPTRARPSGRLLLIGAVFAGLAALRKTACILGKACYNGVRSCSGGAETPRSAAQVRAHPGKRSLLQPAPRCKPPGRGFFVTWGAADWFGYSKCEDRRYTPC